MMIINGCSLFLLKFIGSNSKASCSHTLHLFQRCLIRSSHCSSPIARNFSGVGITGWGGARYNCMWSPPKTLLSPPGSSPASAGHWERKQPPTIPSSSSPPPIPFSPLQRFLALVGVMGQEAWEGRALAGIMAGKLGGEGFQEGKQPPMIPSNSSAPPPKKASQLWWGSHMVASLPAGQQMLVSGRGKLLPVIPPSSPPPPTKLPSFSRNWPQWKSLCDPRWNWETWEGWFGEGQCSFLDGCCPSLPPVAMDLHCSDVFLWFLECFPLNMVHFP